MENRKPNTTRVVKIKTTGKQNACTAGAKIDYLL